SSLIHTRPSSSIKILGFFPVSSIDSNNCFIAVGGRVSSLTICKKFVKLLYNNCKLLNQNCFSFMRFAIGPANHCIISLGSNQSLTAS
ncbi:MAG: hypothetical protein RL023_334, partial [Candidatus Parcubacteria bacterium]